MAFDFTPPRIKNDYHHQRARKRPKMWVRAHRKGRHSASVGTEPRAFNDHEPDFHRSVFIIGHDRQCHHCHSKDITHAHSSSWKILSVLFPGIGGQVGGGWMYRPPACSLRERRASACLPAKPATHDHFSSHWLIDGWDYMMTWHFQSKDFDMEGIIPPFKRRKTRR